ncbi:hypothetical protein ACFC0D_19395 [Streptomyces sp. NPDC056222]|uniref:hypothetical protein n=1 Tax=Streptomyces sp. NPDC056222 TaxID=3345749 RepID=UPI0035D92AAD
MLAILVVLGVVATAMLGWKYREAERTAQARTAALTAAHKAAPTILSHDYRHLDRDFAAARSHLTGPFLDQYGKTTTTAVAPTAKQYRGVVKATVAKPPSGDAALTASVVSASADEVVVLLFMNQLATSTQVSTPRLDLNRVRMTLVRGPQGWKVSALSAASGSANGQHRAGQCPGLLTCTPVGCSPSSRTAPSRPVARAPHDAVRTAIPHGRAAKLKHRKAGESREVPLPQLGAGGDGAVRGEARHDEGRSSPA